MNRYYLCAIIGDGSESNPFRAAVSDHRVNHVAAFPPQDPATGLYSRNLCLALVNAADHLLLLADAESYACPDARLDTKLNLVDLIAFKAAAQARGLNTERFASAENYAAILRDLGRQLDPNFHEENLDVSI